MGKVTDGPTTYFFFAVVGRGRNVRRGYGEKHIVGSVSRFGLCLAQKEVQAFVHLKPRAFTSLQDNFNTSNLNNHFEIKTSEEPISDLCLPLS